ncbi:MAG TPA: CBS domain-containing protein [Kiritimatiellia bacterium]|nr:CBS domain-containing protein [Kiritimatiellia bacterium]
MNKVTLVRSVMTTSLHTLKPDMPIFAAIHLLLKQRISGAPVLDDGGNLVGMLSEKDCLRAFVNGAFFSQSAGAQVSDYMIKDIQTLDADDDIFKAASLFLNHSYRRLPVLDDGKLVGQVSRRDILLASVKMVEESPVKKEWTDSKYIPEEVKAALSDRSSES